MPRGVRQNADRPILGREQEAEALGAVEQQTDDFNFDPGAYAGPLGMPVPDKPGWSFKWVSMTNPETGQDDPREVMKHTGPGMGKWSFVRPEEFPDFMPMKVNHGAYGSIIAAQGMTLMQIPTERRDRLIAHFDSLADRQMEDINGTESAPQQDSRSPFSLTGGLRDTRMRQPTIRE